MNIIEKRIGVYYDTQMHYKYNPIKIEPSIKYDTNAGKFNPIHSKNYNTKINIYNEDTLDCALELKKKYNYRI